MFLLRTTRDVANPAQSGDGCGETPGRDCAESDLTHLGLGGTHSESLPRIGSHSAFGKCPDGDTQLDESDRPLVESSGTGNRFGERILCICHVGIVVAELRIDIR